MADTKVSGLTALAAEPDIADEFYINDVSAGSSGSKKITRANLFSGVPLQVVYSEDGAVATGTTAIPNDDTIPQITEGTQFLSVSITPLQATSLLRIDVVVQCSLAAAAGSNICMALFKTGTSNALAAMAVDSAGNTYLHNIRLTHWVSSAAASSATYTVRIGNGGGNTITFNGASAARKFGGVLASSITITEYAA